LRTEVLGPKQKESDAVRAVDAIADTHGKRCSEDVQLEQVAELFVEPVQRSDVTIVGEKRDQESGGRDAVGLALRVEIGHVIDDVVEEGREIPGYRIANESDDIPVRWVVSEELLASGPSCPNVVQRRLGDRGRHCQRTLELIETVEQMKMIDGGRRAGEGSEGLEHSS
jgi:hypothetical protein